MNFDVKRDMCHAHVHVVKFNSQHNPGAMDDWHSMLSKLCARPPPNLCLELAISRYLTQSRRELVAISPAPLAQVRDPGRAWCMDR